MKILKKIMLPQKKGIQMKCKKTRSFPIFKNYFYEIKLLICNMCVSMCGASLNFSSSCNTVEFRSFVGIICRIDKSQEIVTFDAAMHLYSPPSLVWMLDILRCDTTSPLTLTYCPTWSLSVFESRFPSSSQVISGVGLPLAMQFRKTLGPGWRVSSAKACLIWGGSTVDTG